MARPGGVDMGRLRAVARRAMLSRGLLPEFSAAALAETAAISAPARAEGDAIRDLRALPWVSIDNDDSRDLDQVTVAEAIDAGTTRLLVAVADVDAIVRPGSPIDAHARHNTTSVYTVPQVFPMLPEKLSTGITSLADGEDRLALVIDLSVRRDGSLAASNVYRALVRNQAKLAYNGVGAWLEGRGPAPARLAAVAGLEAQLQLQDGVAQWLRTARFARGALRLETIEARPVFAGALLSDLACESKNRAHELIEDFMIAANGVIARFLAARGVPSLRRVLRTPEKWNRIVTLAARVQATLPAAPSALALDRFLVERHRVDPAGFPDLSLSVIKLLGRGEYVLDLPGSEVPGHFGLAVSDYTHSTAPNRRFPDLLTQRLLKACLIDGVAPYAADELRALAAHCTKQEDAAAKVERHVSKSAAALLLDGRIGETFDAIVTGAADKGTWVRIAGPVVEGRVIRGTAGLAVGDRVRVRLVGTDVERGFIDFECMGESRA